MAKNEHASELAKSKKGMTYKPSEARTAANRKNWQKAVEAIKRKKKGGGDDNNKA